MKGQVDDVKEWKLLGFIESDGEGDTGGLCLEVDLRPYTEIFAIATMTEREKNRRIVLGENKQWYNGRICAMLPETLEQTYTLVTKIDVIEDTLYPWGGYNSGYNAVHDAGSKYFAPAFSPREETYRTVHDVKYIRYDTNNNGAVPAGETLKVYAR